MVAALLVAGCGGGSSDGGNKGSDKGPPSAAEKRKAVKTAKLLYDVARRYGSLNLARGPCIGNILPPPLQDWVVDIAHDPRRPVDEVPRNQCRRYREGKAHHFVELNPAGKLIRKR